MTPQQYPQPQQQQPVQAGVKVEFDAENFDPKFVEKMTQLQDGFNGQLAGLQQQNQMLQQHLLQQQANYQQQQAAYQQQVIQERDNADSRALEAWIETKGDAFRPLFGNGSTVSNPQFQARAMIFQETRRLQNQAAAAGQALDANWARDQAAQRVLGSQFTYFQQQAQRQPVAQRQSQMVGRANGMNSRGGQATGRDAAAARANQWYAEHGLPGS